MQSSVMASKGSEKFLDRVSTEIVGIHHSDRVVHAGKDEHIAQEPDKCNKLFVILNEYLNFRLIGNLPRKQASWFCDGAKKTIKHIAFMI